MPDPSNNLFPELPMGQPDPSAREATPDDIAELIREFDQQPTDLFQNPVAVERSQPLPPDLPAADFPQTVADEIALAESLLTPEQRAARQAKQATPFGDRPVPVVDRSTLQYWGTCPQQAALRELEGQNVTGSLAHSGDAMHHVISMAIWDYMHNAEWKPKDIKQTLEQYALDTPFDVQPDVLDTMRYSAWGLAELIAGISPMNILGFDGGPIDVLKDRSGQIAADFRQPLNWRGTLELDLFYKTAAPTIIEVVDYKTGWKPWSPATIYNEFQFQFAAVLLFLNYPEVMEVHFTVWSPRTGGRSQPVVFLRSRMHEWLARIDTAALAMFKYRGKPLDQIPAYPGEEKCSFCPVARGCHLAYRPAADIDMDPAGYADQMFAVQAKLNAMIETAKSYVKRTGHDVISTTGAAFGFNKPKRKSSPRFAVYGLKASSAAAAEPATDDAGGDE